MKEDLVSICMPTYNGAKFITEALKSAINQSYSNIEIIISDDASKDNTLEIVEQIKQTTNIPLYVFNHEPSGIGANWNNCINKANGDYIKFLFQDDILLPTCTEKMMKIIKSDSKIKLVACKREFILEEEFKSKVIDEWINRYGNLQNKLELKQYDYFSIMDASIFKSPQFLKSPLNKIGEPSTYLFHKNLIKQIGLFREDLKQILDYEFCFRLLKSKPNSIAILNEPLAKFRLHNMQATNVNRGNDHNDYVELNQLMYNDYFWLLSNKLKIHFLKQYNPVIKLLVALKRKLS